MSTPTDVFDEAYKETMLDEGLGILSDDPDDPGGMTYSGITKRWFPTWAGWAIIDKLEKDPKKIKSDPQLMSLVKSFYYINFWNRMDGDSIAALSGDVAKKMFNIGVNKDVKVAVIMLQRILNLTNKNGELYADLVVDGNMGKKTIGALGQFLHTKRTTVSTADRVRLILMCMAALYKYSIIEWIENQKAREKFIGLLLR